jgi:8-amino-7-oxononanoate synthase
MDATSLNDIERLYAIASEKGTIPPTPKRFAERVPEIGVVVGDEQSMVCKLHGIQETRDVSGPFADVCGALLIIAQPAAGIKPDLALERVLESPMKDIQSPHSDFWSTLNADLQAREAAGLSRSVTISRPRSPTTIERHGRELLHFGSNDYLNLAWHPEVQSTFQRLASEPRTGSGASPLIAGASPEYAHLTETLARWEGADAAIVFSSGYAANLGTLTAIASRDDLILSDALNHACLIDGCRLSRATVCVYPHADMNELERLLESKRSQHRFAFVVTDTVFSMEGDIAPVSEIDSICRRFDAIAVADEAHATGVLGPHGRGVLGTQEYDSTRWIRTGTLSKALGCSGGFVSGSSLLIRWLEHQARSWIYSTAMPAANLGAAARAVEILQGMDRERKQLRERSLGLRSALLERGLATRLDPTPIIPVCLGDPQRTLQVARKLFEAGIYVPAIRPPTVPRDRSMLRISLTAAHTAEDLDQLLEQLLRAIASSPAPMT